MIDNNIRWYQDAIVYQLHIKAFFDANNDGIGDFAGLTQKLDYITELGATAIWLLPFYPSPLRDDGYDIAAYKAINERYGKMGDFRRFMREAHQRGLKVITELVINHTSDQHPWFQRARQAKPGSSWRNYYVWSDNDQKYQGTRIIFTDTETSNWTWDPVAKAYYWHRFFSHQPDLNYDNPRVLESVLGVMKFWLDMGVDGLRLDAIPYLCEREGTNNENLPETHAVLKAMRRWLDEHYDNRMFLGEANQWPEDVLPYFGSEEEPECHMAFHFPLMPRMYMALAQEDRHPITDIMNQTPETPSGAQWAVFLRNHDELTLEMVTDRERDYLWNFYASDPRMRINMGIRRRLAPLLDNDRNKIQLLNSMLMSMPGTPIIYYGDEIGMGDNIFLGDRDSVRTPMQWTPDRNGGFSTADPASLYLPAVMDPIYGFEALNVEAQRRNPSSLLNWMQRLVAVRKSQTAFGRGGLRFLYPGNRKVLAYLREYGDDVILCVANLSRAAQPAELDLSEFRGRVPIELMGNSPFPPIGELPYFLTLSPHGFYWFQLATQTEAPPWHTEPAVVLPEFFTLVMHKQVTSLFTGKALQKLETQVLPDFLGKQRWFAGKEQGIDRVRLEQWAAGDDGDLQLTILAVTLNNGSLQRYFLPLDIYWEDREQEVRQFLPFVLSRVRSGNRPGFLLDALGDSATIRQLLQRFVSALSTTSSQQGPLRYSVTNAFPQALDAQTVNITHLNREQSNTSVRIGEELILKAYRQIHAGVHPELEVGRFLTEEAHYHNTPPLCGALEWIDDSGQGTALAVLQGYIPNQGDGWTYTLEYLGRYLHEARYVDDEPQAESASTHDAFIALMHTLGRRTAELHHAFSHSTEDPAFAAEPVTNDDLAHWRQLLETSTDTALQALQQHKERRPAGDPTDELLQRWPELIQRMEALLPTEVKVVKTRCHGDLHLGQVLVAKDDFYFVDFEGEPARPLSSRRSKQLPLRDVAGLLRSLDYAARVAALQHIEMYPAATETALPAALAWVDQVRPALLQGYRASIAGCPSCPELDSDFDALLALSVLEKALYELSYEASNRPEWVGIPTAGLLRWLDDNSGEAQHDE